MKGKQSSKTIRVYLLNQVKGGLPWWPSGQDSVLPMQGALAQSLVRELNPTHGNKSSRMPKLRLGTAKYIFQK